MRSASGNDRRGMFWSWEMPEVSGRTVVVADVLAATTNIARFLHSGVTSLRIADDRTVRQLSRRYPDAVTVGESTVLPKGFFTVSNHPVDVFAYDFRGRDVIFMSSNGSRVIRRALTAGASRVISVSFLNFRAVVGRLGTRSAARYVPVAAGERTYRDKRAPEDRECLEMLQEALDGRRISWQTRLAGLRERMLTYYHRGFDAADLPYVLEHDTADVVPEFSRDSSGTIIGTAL